MALKGNLTDMSLTTIIQVNCEERNQARLLVRHQGKEAGVFFEDGNIVHMTLGNKTGEEVIYELLTWEEGTFELERGIPPPARTVANHWSKLLLEAVHFIDEGTTAGWEAEIEIDEWEETKRKEVSEMPPRKKQSELLAEALNNLLAGSSDIEGGALVGIDGLVLSANVPVKGLDEIDLGAAAAAISGLSRRSVEQLKRGEFFQALIQGSEGNIILTFVDANNIFVGLTAADVNLGMAFREARNVAEELAGILA